jgi:hypothetical protein
MPIIVQKCGRCKKEVAVGIVVPKEVPLADAGKCLADLIDPEGSKYTWLCPFCTTENELRAVIAKKSA